MNSKRGPELTLHSLYPEFAPGELAETEAALMRHLEILLRMYERIRSDPESYAHFRKLTGR